jgi:hypothetical protein
MVHKYKQRSVNISCSPLVEAGGDEHDGNVMGRREIAASQDATASLVVQLLAQRPRGNLGNDEMSYRL